METEKLSKVCRLCMEDCSHAESNSNEEIWEKILECLNISLNRNDDNLPSCICSLCAGKVEDFYEFRRKCWAVQENIVELIPKHNSENPKFSSELEIEADDSDINGPSDALLMKCSICDKEIERNRMEGHINKHKGLRPYQCSTDGCTAAFHCKHARRLHIRCRHGNDTFPCEICGKVYKARRDLLGHKRETHGEAKFECDICQKKFTTRSRLKQHRNYHVGERHHACPVCPSRFFNKFQLRVHARVHTGAKPFACRICSKYFTYRHLAKEHIVRHHGIHQSLDKEWIIAYPEEEL